MKAKQMVAFAVMISGLTFSGASYSGGICCPFSDAKLKENIKPLDSSLEKLLRLNGVSYSWVKDGEKDIGLVAQNVEEVYPELVKEKDGLKQVDYEKLIAPVIEAIREQQKEINSLQSELKQAQEKISKQN